MRAQVKAASASKADMMMVGQSTLSDCDASLLHIQYSRAEPQVSVPLPRGCPFCRGRYWS
jgi:hypothetical protein